MSGAADRTARGVACAAALALGLTACGGPPRPAAAPPSATAATVAATSPATATAATAAAAPPSVALDPHLLDRVAVLGASVSAGFSAPRIAEALAAALAPSPGDPAGARAAAVGALLDRANVWMFRDPWSDGRAQVEAARAHAPTLTLAVDFLFWYAYRDGDAETRAASVERGLAELARLPGALAVGDLPDMRTASQAMLPPHVVPSRDELTALNRRVRAWAAARPRTVVLPLGAWSARLAAAEPVELPDGEVVAAPSLLFVDGLHLNPLGLWWLLHEVDRLLEAELGAVADRARFTRPRPAAAPAGAAPPR